MKRYLVLGQEELLKLLEGVVRRGDGVADRPLVLEDLVVVSALVRLHVSLRQCVPLGWTHLVAEEVDVGEALVGDVVERVGLVPACALAQVRCCILLPVRTVGEDVEADLTADREGQAEVSKLLSELLEHGLSDTVDLVVSSLQGEPELNPPGRTSQTRFAPRSRRYVRWARC